MTRLAVSSRVVPTSVDAYRAAYMDAVAASFDLTRFRVTTRHFNVSRDRRTMEWEFVAEELPWMGLPAGATSARGTFSCRPEKNGMALFPWICSLRCTYTIATGQPRRLAWMHFISLLRYRMQCSAFGVEPSIASPASAPHEAKPESPRGLADIALGGVTAPFEAIFGVLRRRYAAERTGYRTRADERKCFLIGFEIDEGLYLDSRKITFGATWRLFCSFSSILFATGTWKYPGGSDHGMTARDLWATKMKSIMGSRSWLANSVIADADVIIDMGSK